MIFKVFLNFWMLKQRLINKVPCLLYTSRLTNCHLTQVLEKLQIHPSFVTNFTFIEDNLLFLIQKKYMPTHL